MRNGVHFLDRRAGQCAFPVSGSDAGLICCGAAKAKGSLWCGRHQGAARKPNGFEKRQAKSLMRGEQANGKLKAISLRTALKMVGR